MRFHPQDIYCRVAATVLGIDPEQVTEAQRERVKWLTFYVVGSKTLPRRTEEQVFEEMCEALRQLVRT